jgi:hypothetical protein
LNIATTAGTSPVMSLEAMLWALKEAPDVPAHCLGVLMGLAEHADKRGRGAYPSAPTLAAMARKSERQAQYDLDKLADLKLIRLGDQSLVAYLPGGRRTVVYDLAIERVKDGGVQPIALHGGVQPTAPRAGVQPIAPLTSDDLRKDGGVQPIAPQVGCNPLRAGVQPIAPKPSMNLKNKNSLSESSNHTAADPEVLFETEPPAKPPRKSARPPATRIPDDFAVSADMRAWAVKSVPGYDFEGETENFIDWWKSKGGIAAEKVDWPATWRTWMRRNSKEAAAPPRQARGGGTRSNGHQPYRNPADQSVYDRGFGDE